MGFYTNVTTSNDFWHEIAKDPERLVEAISVGMNYGIDDPISEAFDGGRWGERAAHVRPYLPQGVIVHQARHADDPQIIVNTYGSQAIAANEITTAIQNGWLEDDYNEEHAEAVASLLHAEAARIRKAIRNKKAGKSVWAD
jgi:hypothetical protein